MNGTFLGKIISVRFGMGGYQDAQFGLSLTFQFDGSICVTTFIGTWADYPEHARYTREQWSQWRLEALDKLQETMRLAKVDDVTKLLGKPVEVVTEGNALSSWRILAEVL